jgi:hypothetical protein
MIGGSNDSQRKTRPLHKGGLTTTDLLPQEVIPLPKPLQTAPVGPRSAPWAISAKACRSQRWAFVSSHTAEGIIVGVDSSMWITTDDVQ